MLGVKIGNFCRAARAAQYSTKAARAAYKNTVELRNRYLSPSLFTFQAYDTPLVLERGDQTTLWDILGKSISIFLGKTYV